MLPVKTGPPPISQQIHYNHCNIIEQLCHSGSWFVGNHRTPFCSTSATEQRAEDSGRFIGQPDLHHRLYTLPVVQSTSPDNWLPSLLPTELYCGLTGQQWSTSTGYLDNTPHHSQHPIVHSGPSQNNISSDQNLPIASQLSSGAGTSNSHQDTSCETFSASSSS